MKMVVSFCFATKSSLFFFSSRRRHTRSKRDWSQTCALPICGGLEEQVDDRLACAARQDDRQPVLRGLHPHADLIRVRRKAALRRYGERGGQRQRCAEGRDEIGRASCRERGEIASVPGESESR